MLRLSELKELILDEGLDSEDLAILLEITPEELLDRFEDKVQEHYGKFTTSDQQVYDNNGTIGSHSCEDEGDSEDKRYY